MSYSVSLNNVTNGGATTGTIHDHGKPCSNVTAVLTSTAGLTSAGTVSIFLQGSLDGVSWFNIGTVAAVSALGSSAKVSALSSTAFVAQYFRAYVGTLSGLVFTPLNDITGGNITVTIMTLT